jgi:hypothetical protein
MRPEPPQPPTPRSDPTVNSGVADAAFIRAMLSHARGDMSEPLQALPAGITDLRLFHVWITNGVNNLTVR